MIACPRMYAASPSASVAWRVLFEWVAVQAQVDMEVIDHPYPAPLGELWAREDMGCVFMCGLPYSRRNPRPRLIAAPVPSSDRYAGQPIYFTDFVVRAESSFEKLEDTFGGRLAYATEDSHSGYNAVCYHLLGYRTAERPTLFSKVVGPYITPRRVLQAVIEGDADVGPVDSYALDLMRRYTPELVASLRVVASTEAAPIPPLVASPKVDEPIYGRLTTALLAAHRTPELAPTMDALLLTRFAPAQPGDYEVLLQRMRAAEAAGYSRLA